MAEECSHDCNTCSKECGDRKGEASFSAPLNAFSHVKKVIAVASGKGGVGKSLVTSLLASAVQKKGFQAAILDADMTGPSIPKAFGIFGGTVNSEQGIEVCTSKSGVKVMSLNMLMENPSDPVVWRGPVIAGAVKQFWSDVHWGNVDILFVDMPPGTGDVPLTVFQSLPVKGVVIVSSPQELVGLIVEKSVKMAGMLHQKVLALVENMSYFECPSCHTKHAIFGTSHAHESAQAHGIETVCQLPLDPTIAQAVDRGDVESLDFPALNELVTKLCEQP